MHHFTMACSLVLAVSLLELLSACGLEENGERQRQTIFVSRSNSDAIAHAGDGSSNQEALPAEDGEGENQSNSSPQKSEEEQIADMPVRLGMRDFHQINQTMAFLTGVPSTTPAIKTLYDNELRTQLPVSNDIKGFLSSHQVGISKLATEYCDNLMANTTLRGTILTGFNFNQPPVAGLTDAQAGMISGALLNRFWGPALANQPDRAAAVADLKALIVDLRTSATAATPAETLNIIKGACTATLASSAVTTF
jgi:hypothetical protein